MKNVIKYINLILIITFIIFFPTFNIFLQDNRTLLLIVLCIINFFIIINYILNFKNMINFKKYFFYILLLLSLLSPFLYSIFNLKLHLLVMGCYINYFLISLNIYYLFKDKKESFIKILLISITISSLISIFYKFNPYLFNQLHIVGYYGDYYLTSVYRVYGVFYYPNATALLCLVGILLSLYLLRNKMNILYIFYLYINLLLLLLTMSKFIILLFIIFIVLLFIFKFKESKYIIFSILPIFINLNIYRESIINNI